MAGKTCDLVHTAVYSPRHTTEKAVLQWPSDSCNKATSHRLDFVPAIAASECLSEPSVRLRPGLPLWVLQAGLPAVNSWARRTSQVQRATSGDRMPKKLLLKAAKNNSDKARAKRCILCIGLHLAHLLMPHRNELLGLSGGHEETNTLCDRQRIAAPMHRSASRN